MNIGQIIGKGQLLAELDDRLIRQELEKAKAAVEIAEANLEQSSNALLLATEELERNRTLLERSFISQAEFDAINSRFISEKSKSNIAQASLNSAMLLRIQLNCNSLLPESQQTGRIQPRTV